MRILNYLLASLFFIALPVWATTLETRIDPGPIVVGSAFPLYITANDYTGSAQPDIKKLTKDFSLAGLQQAREIQIVNGNATRRTDWVLLLVPKQGGKITIPSLQLGKFNSKPLLITVLDPNGAGSAMMNTGTSTNTKPIPNVLMETAVSNQNPYVQEQVIYTVKVLYNNKIQSAVLTDPVINNAKIASVQNNSYQTQKDGRAYHVYERRYFIFPQASGTLTIKPGALQGTVLSNNANSQWGQLLDAGVRPVNLTSTVTTLQVKPEASMTQGQWWLPTPHLQMQETWSQDPNKAVEGQPITRTITITAQGLSSSQLPILVQPDVKGLSIYPDKPELQDKLISKSDWLYGVQQTKIAYVPTQTGALHLPAVAMTWWNTKTQKTEIASLPAMTLQVAPAANANTASTPAVNTAKPDNNFIEKEKNSLGFELLPWDLALIFLGAWIATWLMLKKQRQKFSSSLLRNRSVHVCEEKIKQACLANNPTLTKDYLLQWAGFHFPEQKPQNLVVLATLITDEDLHQALRVLDRTIYNALPDWDGSAFWEAFVAGGLTKPQTRKSEAKTLDLLPPLYPE